MSVSVKHCGPIVCQINDRQFTYINHLDLIPQLALYFNDEYDKVGLDGLTKSHELYKINISHDDAMSIDTAILHVINHRNKIIYQ